METITSKKFSLPLGQTGTQITKLKIIRAVKDMYVQKELNLAATLQKFFT